MNTDVPGSPASCRASADALALLAHHLEEAERLAARGAHTSDVRFAGVTADSYRAACAGLVASASDLGGSATRAGAALASYGDDLAAVQRVMERVRGTAGAHGLLDGTRLALPPAPTPRQQRAFDRLSAIAADALDHLDRARDCLSAAFPGQPFPADYGSVLLPPAGEPHGPFAFPPPESSWPPDPRPSKEPPAPDRDTDERNGSRGTGGAEPHGQRDQGDQGDQGDQDATGPHVEPDDPLHAGPHVEPRDPCQPADPGNPGDDGPRPDAPSFRIHCGGSVWHSHDLPGGPVLRPVPEAAR